MSAMSHHYDVIVCGGGPAGCSAVSICSWLQKRVCVVDPRGHLWPAPTGAVSKIHRACAQLYGDPEGGKRVPWSVVEKHLAETVARVSKLPLPHEGAAATGGGSARTGLTGGDRRVTVLKGYAHLVDEHTVAVLPTPMPSSSGPTVAKAGASAGAGRPDTAVVQAVTVKPDPTLPHITADVILLATGSVPARLPGVPFDGRFVFTSDDIASIGRTPYRIVIQGAGIIGVEYAFIMRRLGAEVVLVEFTPVVLPLMDVAIRDAVLDELARVGVRVVTNSTVEFVSVPPKTKGDETPADRDRPESMHLRVKPRDAGKKPTDIRCDAYMAATGRRGNSESLGAEAVGLKRGRMGHIEVHPRSMWTGVGKIYAAGDVSGLSAFQPHGLVTTGQAQAIRAVYSAFVNEWPSSQLRADYFEHVPVALWVTPDVAYVGLTEADAAKRYGEHRVATSRADYSSTVKDCILPSPGFIKLVYLLDGGQILGAHLFGEDASEMIHYGAMLVNCRHTVFEVVKEVVAGVTYQEAYRTAGLDASKRVSAHLSSITSRL